MNEGLTGLIIFISILVGMLMAFGLVLVFVFFGSDDMACRSALYGLVATFLR